MELHSSTATTNFSDITPEILHLSRLSEQAGTISSDLYTKYDVKRGLRDLNGKGVLAGLTNISDVRATKMVDGKAVPDHGKLFYRGYNVEDLVQGFHDDDRFGFDEVTYLLLFDKLPTKEELASFSALLASYRSLPTSFVRDIIMKAPSKDMMNTLARSVLTLYSYDDRADDVSLPNVLRQCLQLISMCPMLSIYGYQAYSHYHDGNSLYIHQPSQTLSMAENILHILRPDSKYTPLEAKILDIALILHMEHGGGNNSSFTTRVVTSSLSDTYSVIAAAIGSLKGPRHGGANIKVVQMFEEMKKEVRDWKDDEEISRYLNRLLNKDAFDHAGLIYGVGHAVYLSFTTAWNASPLRLSPANARCTKASASTWISIPASFTRCSGFRSSFIPRSLRSPAWSAGVPTGWKSLPPTERSSVPHTRRSALTGIMWIWKKDKNKCRQAGIHRESSRHTSLFYRSVVLSLCLMKDSLPLFRRGF